MFYEQPLERSWTYLMNYPAYHEEVSEYSSYYPFWNCGLGLLTVIEYTENIDDAYLWYGDSCAQFLMDSSLSFHHSLYYYENLHPIVTAFGAGCLYRWGEYTDNTEMRERALYFAEQVLTFLEVDPDSFLDNEAWAMSSKNTHVGVTLSPRQLEIIDAISQGKSNKSIARDLSITEGTVKQHASNIFKLLKVSNRTLAIQRSRDLGLLS